MNSPTLALGIQKKCTDYVEDHEGQLAGFKFKLTKKASKAPGAWGTNYPGATYADVNRENYLDFML